MQMNGADLGYCRFHFPVLIKMNLDIFASHNSYLKMRFLGNKLSFKHVFLLSSCIIGCSLSLKIVGCTLINRVYNSIKNHLKNATILGA